MNEPLVSWGGGVWNTWCIEKKITNLRPTFCLHVPQRLTFLTVALLPPSQALPSAPYSFQQDQSLSDCLHTHSSADSCSTDQQPWLYGTPPLCLRDSWSSFIPGEVSGRETWSLTRATGGFVLGGRLRVAVQTIIFWNIKRRIDARKQTYKKS